MNQLNHTIDAKINIWDGARYCDQMARSLYWKLGWAASASLRGSLDDQLNRLLFIHLSTML